MSLNESAILAMLSANSGGQIKRSFPVARYPVARGDMVWFDNNQVAKVLPQLGNPVVTSGAMRLAKLSDGKYLAVYAAPVHVYTQIITLSDDTTVNVANAIDSGITVNGGSYFIATIDASHVLFVSSNSGESSGYLVARVLTINADGSVTGGTPVALSTVAIGASAIVDVKMLDSTKAVIAYSNTGNFGNLLISTISISGTTISVKTLATALTSYSAGTGVSKVRVGVLTPTNVLIMYDTATTAVGIYVLPVMLNADGSFNQKGTATSISSTNGVPIDMCETGYDAVVAVCRTGTTTSSSGYIFKSYTSGASFPTLNEAGSITISPASGKFTNALIISPMGVTEGGIYNLAVILRFAAVTPYNLRYYQLSRQADGTLSYGGMYHLSVDASNADDTPLAGAPIDEQRTLVLYTNASGNELAAVATYPHDWQAIATEDGDVGANVMVAFDGIVEANVPITAGAQCIQPDLVGYGTSLTSAQIVGIGISPTEIAITNPITGR